MKGKTNTVTLFSAGFIALLPALQLVTGENDFQAIISFVMWILIGAIIVKVLAIFAGVS